MFERILNRGRARTLARKLASEPTAENYLAMAQSYASGGQLTQVAKVCEEGLGLHPGNAELERMLGRSQALAREDLVRDLQRQLKSSPRPAVYRELCETQIKAGRLDRAEKVAEEWFVKTQDGEALFQRAQVRAARYFADRRRDDARVALELLDRFLAENSNELRAIRLSLDIYTRCGAWHEARTCLARMLEIRPGDPVLEARFRTVASISENAPSLDQALREVERTGNFVDDETDTTSSESALALRPMLQSLASKPGVNGAFYIQGGTALVQGPRGATAERYARGVRELLTIGRSSARRLGLGAPVDIQVEGEFGSISIRSGSIGAAALWTEDRPNEKTSAALDYLSGREAQGGTHA